MIREIEELVKGSILSAVPSHFLELGEVEIIHANRITDLVDIHISGAKYVIDTSGIRHAIKNHGDPTLELKRGQIAICNEDFLKIPEILVNPDSIEYGGTNPLKQHVFIYSKRIDELHFVVKAFRPSIKKGNKLIFQTMYKRK